jgi:hypothetical protein
MARTIAQIQAALIATLAADPAIAPVMADTSLTADWLLWTWEVSTAQWITESLYDMHVAEVQSIIALQKPHTLQWYATIAKAFQYGASLPPDSDVYVPVAPAGDVSLVVTYAAAVELPGEVRIKVATGVAGSLSALSGAQLIAFTEYMGRVKDAGVRLNCTTGPADNLQLGMNIYYDPLVLDATGARLDGTNATPVLDAINLFLDTLPFNGVFVYNLFVAALQAVSGVVIAEPLVCQANYGATPYIDIKGAAPSVYTPDAGYMALDLGYFNVTYIAYP